MKPWTLNNLKPRQIHLAGMALLGLGALVVYVGAVRPAVDRNTAAAAEVLLLEGRRSDAQRLARQCDDLRATLADARERLAASRVQLRPAGHVNRQIAMLSELAGAQGLKITEVEPGKPLPAGQLVGVPVRMAGSGSYGMWAAFLHALAEKLPDTRVEAFNLTSEPANGAAAFQIDLVWYALP